MNTTLKKSFCIIQLLCMSYSLHADWANELRDILKICAIAGTSIFIYAKWFGQPKLEGNNSMLLQNGVTSNIPSDNKEVKELKKKINDLEKRIEEFNQKEEDLESEITESNSVNEPQNQVDILSGGERLTELLQRVGDIESKLSDSKNDLSYEKIEKLIQDKVNSGYSRLFSVMYNCSQALLQLTEKQVELEQTIKQHADIIGNGFEQMQDLSKLYPEERANMVKDFEEDICETAEKLSYPTCLQALKNEDVQHEEIIGNGFEKIQDLSKPCYAEHIDLADDFYKYISEVAEASECTTCFQTLKNEVEQLKALVGKGISENGKIVNLTQVCALLISSFIVLDKKIDWEISTVNTPFIFGDPSIGL